MNTCICFIDPTFSEDKLRLRVLQGFHGLHHYANEFWFQRTLLSNQKNLPLGHAAVVMAPSIVWPNFDLNVC